MSASDHEPFPAAQIAALRRGRAKVSEARLRTSTARLARQNDTYARRMSVRLARWEGLGMLQPVPGAKP